VDTRTEHGRLLAPADVCASNLGDPCAFIYALTRWTSNLFRAPCASYVAN